RPAGGRVGDLRRDEAGAGAFECGCRGVAAEPGRSRRAPRAPLEKLHEHRGGCRRRRMGERARRDPLARARGHPCARGRPPLEHAAAAGVDVPTPEPGTFPVIVKPDRSVEFKRRYRRQAFRCETPAELDDALAKTEEFGAIVQEFVPGGDDTLYTVGSYVDRD